MKKALLTLAAVAMVGSTHAQGLITFQHFDGSKPIRIPGGATADSSYTVGLFKSDNLTTPLATTAIFQSTGLFQFDGSDVTVPGVPANSTANLTVRAWQTSAGSYAASAIKGEGAFISLPLGGVNPTPPPPSLTAPDLTGFQGFTMVPEPSTYALGIAGLGALAMMRRRK